MSSSRSKTTSGVIQPPHSLSLGKAALSSTTTSAPPCLRRVAAAEPAGPPPTTMTSALRMLGSARIHVLPRQRQLVVLLNRKKDLKQLHRPGIEGSASTGQIPPPHAHEDLIEARAHLIDGGFVAGQPLAQGERIVQTNVLNVDDRQIPGLEDLHHLAARGRVGTREDSPLD